MVVEVGIAPDQVLYPLPQFAPFSLHVPARDARPERWADQIVQVVGNAVVCRKERRVRIDRVVAFGVRPLGGAG